MYFCLSFCVYSNHQTGYEFFSTRHCWLTLIFEIISHALTLSTNRHNNVQPMVNNKRERFCNFVIYTLINVSWGAPFGNNTPSQNKSNQQHKNVIMLNTGSHQFAPSITEKAATKGSQSDFATPQNPAHWSKKARDPLWHFNTSKKRTFWSMKGSRQIGGSSVHSSLILWEMVTNM